jgi:hypothetical protein
LNTFYRIKRSITSRPWFEVAEASTSSDGWTSLCISAGG